MTETHWTDGIAHRLADLDDECRAAIVRAGVEAGGMRSEVVGSEHLLLAVLADADSSGAHALANQGITYAAAREFFSGLAPRGAAPKPQRSSEDLIAVVEAAAARRPDVSPAPSSELGQLVLAIASVPGPVTRALLESYAVTPRSVADLMASVPPELTTSDDPHREPTGITDPHRAPEIPSDVREASPIALSLVRDALAEQLTLDGFIRRMMTLRDRFQARSILALRSLDVDCDELGELIAQESRALQRQEAQGADPELLRALSAVSSWLPRTGDQQPDTVHLLLAALSVAPQGEFARALRVFGVTSDLLVGAAVDVRFDVGIHDKPGTPESLTQESRRGALPKSPIATPQPLKKVARSRWRRRMFRGGSPTGVHLNSDLQMGRIGRWAVGTTVQAGAGVVLVITVVGSAISTRNWWLLLAIPLSGVQPAALPLPVCLISWAAGFYFVPWPAKVALVVLASSQCLTTWLELQWRRADTADPTFDLRRLRRDTRTSHRSLLMGGPT